MGDPKYTKHVVWRAHLWVEATVMRNGFGVCIKRVIPFIDNHFFVGRSFKKAHKWADGFIKVLQEQET